MKGTFFGADFAFSPDFIKDAGTASEAAVVSFQAPPYDSSPELQKFAAAYKQAFGEEPGPYSAYGYQEASIVIEATKKVAKVDRASFVDEIAKSDFDGLVVHVAFTPEGELKKPFIFLYTVKNGAFSLVK